MTTENPLSAFIKRVEKLTSVEPASDRSLFVTDANDIVYYLEHVGYLHRPAGMWLHSLVAHETSRGGCRDHPEQCELIYVKVLR